MTEYCNCKKPTEEGFDHKNLRVTTVKYPSSYRNHTY